MWMCNIQIIKNGNDIRRIWLKTKTISQSFIHCIPALKKNWKSSLLKIQCRQWVERAADLKALLEFNLIYYAHVWLLLRVYSILADQALHQKLKNERFVQNWNLSIIWISKSLFCTAEGYFDFKAGEGCTSPLLEL